LKIEFVGGGKERTRSRGRTPEESFMIFSSRPKKRTAIVLQGGGRSRKKQQRRGERGRKKSKLETRPAPLSFLQGQAVVSREGGTVLIPEKGNKKINSMPDSADNHQEPRDFVKRKAWERFAC